MFYSNKRFLILNSSKLEFKNPDHLNDDAFKLNATFRTVHRRAGRQEALRSFGSQLIIQFAVDHNDSSFAFACKISNQALDNHQKQVDQVEKREG